MSTSPPSKLSLILGLVLVAAGWGVVFAGWYQASRQELEAGQIPYVISGGIGGLGLLVLGATGILVYVLQRAHWQQRSAIDELVRALSTRLDARAEADPALDGTRELPERRRRRRRRAAER